MPLCKNLKLPNGPKCGKPELPPIVRGRIDASMATSLDDMKSPMFWRAVGAEVIGTGFLVLVGCGSCVNMGSSASLVLKNNGSNQVPILDLGSAPSYLHIALCFGLIVATMVWAIGHISGGHINPAVTVAMLITRKVSVARAVLFILAQCIGAIIGAAILRGLTPAAKRGALGCTIPNPDIGANQAFGVEFLITFVLVFIVFSSIDHKRTDIGGSIPLTIGLSVGVCHLFAIQYTGSSMNPARSFGPAAVMNIWTEHWVYWCGPLLGGVVAGLLYENVFAANASWKKAKGYLLASDYDSAKYQENPEKPAKIMEQDDTV